MEADDKADTSAIKRVSPEFAASFAASFGAVNAVCFDLLLIELLRTFNPDMLDKIGFQTGFSLAERFSMGLPVMKDQLDRVKFICKDLWMLLFDRQIDNLKTNYKGAFVLSDYSFKWLLRMSAPGNLQKVPPEAQKFMRFPSSLIRGALANLGEDMNVTAEIDHLPGVTFRISDNRREQQSID